MNRTVIYSSLGRIDNDENINDDNKGSSSLMVVVIATFINQCTKKYTIILLQFYLPSYIIR